MLPVVIALAFAAGMLLALTLGGWLGAEREVIARRLDTLTRSEGSVAQTLSLADAELEGGWRQRLVQPAWQWVARLSLRWMPSGTTERLRASLARAGDPPGLGVGEFAGLRALSVMICLGLAAWLCGLCAGPMLRLVCLGLGLLTGLTLPDALLERSIRRRQTQIRRALPDVVDLLVVSVEAGLGLDGALAKVMEKMHGPLPDELARAIGETHLGKTRAQSLKDMAARVEVGEVKTFVAAVTQAEGLGVSIVRTLRAQSQSVRAARMQRVREQAARLPVTLLLPLTLFIFPAIFVVLLGPSLIRLYHALAGMH